MTAEAENELNAASLLRRMVDGEASDLHLKEGNPPVLRVDGELRSQELPALSAAAMGSILKEITNEEQRERFEEEKELDFAYTAAGSGRFRVNAALQRGSITLAFRLVKESIPSLEELGLPEICGSLALKPRGLVLVTGPTGCGKSTTLAAMIEHLNERERRHVVTIEDPIEYVHRNKKCLISQRELGADTRSFAAALTHALRQDPDVILVGEMRDLATIGAALTAAETGHLVLATLHTPSAPQTIDRVIDVFPPHQQQQVRVQLSLVLEAVLCQTLVPKIHGEGRVPAMEIMVATSAIRNLIREGKTHQLLNVIQTGAQSGMRTLDQALAALSQGGVIRPEDALERCQNPDEMRRLLMPQDSVAA
jgi:twitching motility protein PilT